MIVQEVRLENVKSYGSPAEVVRLSRGVNAICGQNGSGKSTILEAIGCALFLHLPYRHQDFVREGETSGTITVVVESRLDQRTYEIVRKVGNGAVHYVYDPDIHQQIARGEADVRRWLHQHLKIDEEVDLRALFLDSVGPPQGTLTAAFLDSPQERRSKFDRLLRVAEYDEAYRRLGALESAIDDERDEVKLAITRLEPLTERRREIEARLADVRERQYNLAVQLQRYVAEQKALEHEIEVYVRAEQEWHRAEHDLELAREREKSVNEALEHARVEYRRAADARQTCQRCQAGYEAYVQAVEHLRSLEADQNERDRLQKERIRASEQVQRLRSRIDLLDSDIARAEQAAHEAAELQKKIPEQEAAERRLQAARDARTESTQLQKHISSLESQIDRARRHAEQLEKDVASALEQQPIAAELSARRENHQRLTDELAAANRAVGELTALRRSLDEARQRAERGRKQLEEIDAQIAVASASQEDAAQLEAHETTRQQIAEQRAAATSHLEHARATRQQVAGGLCPFLHEACRNLRPGVTLEAHFDEEIRAWSARLSDLDRHLQEIDRRVQIAREAKAKADALPQLQRQRERLVADLRQEAEKIAQDQAKIQKTAELATRATEVKRAAQAAELLVREAERAAHEVSRLGPLRQALDEARATLLTLQSELDTAQRRLDALQPVVDDLPAAVAILNALGGPREQVGRLLAEAAKIDRLRAAREDANVALDQASARVEELDRLLASYRDLDDQLARLRRRRDECRADHDAYTAAVALAQAFDERSSALARAEAQAATAHDQAAAAQQRLEEATRSYDRDAHKRAVERRNGLESAIGEVRARMEESEVDESRLNAELDQIHHYEQELAAHRRRLEEIDEESQLAGLLRQSIKSAGPEITRQLLARISRMASRINAEILNQAGVELEWTDSYEIVTKYQGETRGFAQLSGGEQMAAALAVRLAILRDLSNVRIAFLDEPTAHLDQERRTNLGDQVQRLQGFDQLVVISHDDTFDGLFGHVIRIGRESGRSRVLDES